jgi:hypothetical protein
VHEVIGVSDKVCAENREAFLVKHTDPKRFAVYERIKKNPAEIYKT